MKFMKNPIVILVLCVALVLCLVVGGMFACGNKAEDKKKAPSEKVEAENNALHALSVVLVTEKGGPQKSRISSMFLAGCKKAEDNLGIQLSVIVPNDKENYEEALIRGIELKPDMILCGGPALKTALKTVAFKNQDMNFACVSDEDLGNNVVGISFREEEGGFLAGALAALMTDLNKGDVVSFITAADSPATKKLEYGFISGAKTVNKQMYVVKNSLNDWNDQDRAREVAFAHHALGADVIFMAAGESGKGIIRAAKEKNIMVINQGTNLEEGQETQVVASIGKRVDKAVYSLIKAAAGGKFPQYNMVFSIADGGIELEYEEGSLPPDVKKQLDDYADKIKNKKIVVPSDWDGYSKYERGL